jgi:hypothetical protein
MSPGEQNLKTGPDALSIEGNDSRSAKHENGTRHPRFRRKRDLLPSGLPKTSPGAPNMKTGPDAIGTDENMYGSTKHENGS